MTTPTSGPAAIALDARSPAIAAWDFNTPITGLALTPDETHLVIADGAGVLHSLALDAVDAESSWNAAEAHNGASLAIVPGPTAGSVLSGGDDGRLALWEDGEVSTLAEHKGQWLDQIAAHDGAGLVAYGLGKRVMIRRADGEAVGEPHEMPSSIGGLAFNPKGKRLAVGHYGGVSLLWTNAQQQKPERLEWAGPHGAVSWHPNGDFLLTSLQDNSLHGWRMKDKAEMRMQGYAAKVQSLAGADGGKYLATSGAEVAICWPFFAGGPWGKPPLQVGPPVNNLVTQTAAHPKDPLLANGYDNGLVALAPLTGEGPLKLRDPSGAPIVGLAWNSDGTLLVSVDEAGKVHLYTVDSVSRAFMP